MTLQLPFFTLFVLLSLGGQLALYWLQPGDYYRDLPLFILSAVLHSLFYGFLASLILSLTTRRWKKPAAFFGGLMLFLSFSAIPEFISMGVFKLHISQAVPFFLEAYKSDLSTLQPYLIIPILEGFAAALVLLICCIVIYRWLSARFTKLHFPISPKLLTGLTVGTFTLLLIQQFAGSKLHSDKSKMCQLSVPFAVSSLFNYENNSGMMKFKDVLYPVPPTEKKIQEIVTSLSPNSLTKKPNIFLFVIDSLRKDVVFPELAPHMSSLLKDSLPIDHFIANSNGTHGSWYSLFSSTHSLSWPILAESNKGGTVLRVLKQLGYKTHIFTSAEYDIFNMRNSIFGTGLTLVDTYVGYHELLKEDPKGNFATRDITIVKKLDELLERTKEEEGNFFLIAVNSLHWAYEKPKDFVPPPTDFVPSLIKDASKNHHFIQSPDHMFANYRTSLIFLDNLIGSFIDKAKKSNRYANSVIITMGDHGEEFGEHGNLFHANSMNTQQLDPSIALKLPAGATPLKQPRRMASIIDIFPTLFDHLGVWDNVRSIMSGQSLLREEEPAPVLAINSSWIFSQNFRIYDRGIAADFEADDLGGYDQLLLSKGLRLKGFSDGYDKTISLSKNEAEAWTLQALKKVGITARSHEVSTQSIGPLATK